MPLRPTVYAKNDCAYSGRSYGSVSIGVDLSFFETIDTYRFSGIGIFTDQLLHGFSAEFALVLFVYDDIREDIAALFPAARVCSFPRSRLPLQSLRFSAAARQIARLVRENHIDRLFTPKLDAYSYIPRAIPTFAVLHDLDFMHSTASSLKYQLLSYLRREALRSKLPRVPHIITISDYVKQDLLQSFPGCSAARVHVIHNAVELPVASDSSLELPEDYILNVNAFRHNKNQITLIKAYARLRERYPELKLVLVGAPAEALAGLHEYVEAQGLTGSVLFYHNISSADLAKCYRGARLFANSSTFEGFGRSPIEAGLYGLPVVTSKDMSLYEVTLGLTEYYEPTTDDGALYEAMLRVLEHPETYPQGRIAAIQQAFTCYSVPSITANYIELLR